MRFIFRIKDHYYRHYVAINKKFKFENRKKDYEKLCIVIAGYKPFLYDIVFKRINTFLPKDIEVCIVSSGKYDEKLSNIAKDNGYSYISTNRNSVALAQNIVINAFPKAKYIYKLDEDIFITKGYFETLMKTYRDCETKGEYNVGIVAPLIPINGYGHMKILKRFNLLGYYEKHFEKPIYAAGRDRMIESNPDVAKFFWGNENIVPSLDKMNEGLSHDEFSYEACPIRFSIGAILFERQFWKEMGMFKVDSGNGMGMDEEQVCAQCINCSKAIIVSNNVVVGHLSFGVQNEPMKEYFLENQEKFDIKE